jgi:hypothetical protein
MADDLGPMAAEKYSPRPPEGAEAGPGSAEFARRKIHPVPILPQPPRAPWRSVILSVGSSDRDLVGGEPPWL